MSSALRIGIDLGGTKIAGVMLDGQGAVIAARETETPKGTYAGTLDAIRELVAALETEIGAKASVGVGIPGSLSPSTGKVRNANSTWLNGERLDADLSRLLEREVRIANDANCFALSEAQDGAAAGARIVFGVILGTGCGGGLVVDGRLVDGPLGIGGEWGHNPLPWPEADELPGPPCWCGRNGCIETWVSGPGISQDHMRITSENLSAEAIARRASEGDAAAIASLDRHVSRLARALGALINLIDPHVIVLGGGLSQMPHLYDRLPGEIAPHLFTDAPNVTVKPPVHGPASGVRGAAWLWGGPQTKAD